MTDEKGTRRRDAQDAIIEAFDGSDELLVTARIGSAVHFTYEGVEYWVSPKQGSPYGTFEGENR